MGKIITGLCSMHHPCRMRGVRHLQSPACVLGLALWLLGSVPGSAYADGFNVAGSFGTEAQGSTYDVFGATGASGSGADISGSGISSASLSSGSLSVSALSNPPNAGGYQAFAGMSDTLTFQNVPVGGATGTLTLPVIGTFSSDSIGSAKVYILAGAETVCNYGLGATCALPGDVSLSFFIPASGDVFSLGASIIVAVVPGGGNGGGPLQTAVLDPPLELTLTGGTTFTSASGVFLSSPAAVPEPASFLLLGSGLAGLVTLRKRLRCSQGQSVQHN